MRSKKSMFAIAGGAIVVATVVFCSGIIEGYERRYDLRPEIRLPEHRTDAARAIDAYERVMERYMKLSERNFGSIGGDVKDVARKLDLIDDRLARIEKVLGIERPKTPIPQEQVLKKAEPRDGKVVPQGLPRQPEKVERAEGGGNYSL